MSLHPSTNHDDPGCECCRRKLLTGARLRRLRRERGLTQAQLAGILGVSDRLISAWERGEGLPTLWSAFHLAHALNRQLVDLFFPIHDFARQQLDSHATDDTTDHGAA